MPITAFMLYDLIACPNRLGMDPFTSPVDRGPIIPLIRMLWEKGTAHEHEIMSERDTKALDLSGYHGDEKERLTTEAMARQEPIIYRGRITADDLVGEPDLLRWTGAGYQTGDIISRIGGGGRENHSKGKFHYAVRLALYVDVLERKGLSAGRTPFIIDIAGDEITYDLEEPMGVGHPTTFWVEYKTALVRARLIAADRRRPKLYTAARAGSVSSVRLVRRLWKKPPA
jgi:hypothetical protein